MAKDGSMGMIIGLGVAAAAAYALYEFLQSQCQTKGSSLYGGTICNALNTSFPSAFTTGAPLTAAQIAAVTAGQLATANSTLVNPATTQTTAKLTNVTAPGQPFAAGDSFQLLVTGPPNSPVIGTASQNGAVTSSTNFGTTNSVGQFLTTGSWDSSHVGSWVESWQVGSSTPASLAFSIAGSGVSGIGYINRIPRGFINRRRLG